MYLNSTITKGLARALGIDVFERVAYATLNIIDNKVQLEIYGERGAKISRSFPVEVIINTLFEAGYNAGFKAGEAKCPKERKRS